MTRGRHRLRKWLSSFKEPRNFMISPLYRFISTAYFKMQCYADAGRSGGVSMRLYYGGLPISERPLYDADGLMFYF